MERKNRLCGQARDWSALCGAFRALCRGADKGEMRDGLLYIAATTQGARIVKLVKGRAGASPRLPAGVHQVGAGTNVFQGYAMPDVERIQSLAASSGASIVVIRGERGGWNVEFDGATVGQRETLYLVLFALMVDPATLEIKALPRRVEALACLRGEGTSFGAGDECLALAEKLEAGPPAR